MMGITSRGLRSDCITPNRHTAKGSHQPYGGSPIAETMAQGNTIRLAAANQSAGMLIRARNHSGRRRARMSKPKWINAAT